MPNWCYGQMRVKGDKQNKEELLKLFLVEDSNVNKQKKEYIARTWINCIDGETIANELNNEVTIIDFYCAWSVYSCMINGYPNDKECLTLSKITEKLNLDIQIVSEEQGMCFREFYQFKNGEQLINDSEDFPEDEFDEEELYKEYLKNWAETHTEGIPASFEEWQDCEYQELRDAWYNAVYDKFTAEFAR